VLTECQEPIERSPETIPAAAERPLEADAPRPVTRIRPRSGWQAVNVAQLWAYRELLYFLVWRDIKVRYKQTVFGAAWAVLQPVMAMVVFSLFFGRLGGMSSLVDVPYPVFVFAGLLPWTLFAAVLGQAGVSLLNSGNMISKVFFPRLLVPLASAGTALVDFLLAFVVMVFMMAGYGVTPSPQLLLLPLMLAGVLTAAIGMGTLLAALVVAYRDFRHVLGFLTQLWMFASPVVYPMEVVPDRWQLLYALNPMVGMISGFRSCLLGLPFHWDVIGVSFLTGLAMLVVGLFYFRRQERRFADIL
jgi:lipopolysaccharide transport system permease protein